MRRRVETKAPLYPTKRKFPIHGQEMLDAVCPRRPMKTETPSRRPILLSEHLHYALPSPLHNSGTSRYQKARNTASFIPPVQTPAQKFQRSKYGGSGPRLITIFHFLYFLSWSAIGKPAAPETLLLPWVGEAPQRRRPGRKAPWTAFGCLAPTASTARNREALYNDHTRVVWPWNMFYDYRI